MIDTHNHSDLPTALEMLEAVLLLISGAVVAAPALPGFTFCVLGLILLSAVKYTARARVVATSRPLG